VGSQSNHGSEAMSVDQASHESGDQEAQIRVLTSDEHIILVDNRERQAFHIIKDQTFHHIHAYDHDFMNRTSMITEFQAIFRAVGWENFWQVNEDGCRELTIEFLCTLTRTATHVTFRLFGEQYTFTWKNFSILLGFDKNCNPNLDRAIEGFDRVDFWKEISDKDSPTQPRTSEIHNPTLRFMHRWLAITLFPGNELHIVRVEEMKIIYAMVNKIRISPVVGMIDYWLGTFSRDEYVECTSLITRLARNMGLLDRALINYIPTNRVYLDYYYFFQAHMMKIDQEDDSYVMTYQGYVNEIRLPNMQLWLSNVDRLTIPLEPTEVYNHRIASEM
jgi:hypothetical protein